MRVYTTGSLFAWERLEDSPSLQAVRRFLDGVPDAALLESPRQFRGRGRDDYPARALWGTLLLTIVLRHPSIEACLGEPARNAELRKLIGIASEERVPKKWNMSRFLDVLGRAPHSTHLRAIFEALIRRLGAAVGELGRRVAGDSSGLSARKLPEQAKYTPAPLPPTAVWPLRPGMGKLLDWHRGPRSGSRVAGRRRAARGRAHQGERRAWQTRWRLSLRSSRCAAASRASTSISRRSSR